MMIKKPKYWWKYQEAPLEKELRRILREFRLLLVQFRKWYFDNPKDKFERWLKRIERGIFVWTPVILVSLRLLGRW